MKSTIAVAREPTLTCPARAYGNIAACRFCIYRPGGASDLCLKMWRAWDKERAAKLARQQATDE